MLIVKKFSLSIITTHDLHKDMDDNRFQPIDEYVNACVHAWLLYKINWLNRCYLFLKYVSYLCVGGLNGRPLLPAIGSLMSVLSGFSLVFKFKLCDDAVDPGRLLGVIFAFGVELDCPVSVGEEEIGIFGLLVGLFNWLCLSLSS